MIHQRLHFPRALERQHLPLAAFLSSVSLLGALACSDSERQASQSEPGASAGASGTPGSTASEDPSVAAGGSAGSADPAGTEDPATGDVIPVDMLPGVGCGELVCSAFASCGSTGAEASCQCALGLEGDGQRCLDIDECAQTPELCGAHGSCQNGFGSYDCSCDGGYAWDGTSCVDVDECEHDPCDASALCSNDVDGGFTCTCGAGTYGDGFFCNASDACAGNPCGDDGACVNVPEAAGGVGYACQCQPGFSGNEACAACGADLVLADPALRAAVNRQLGRALDDASPIPLGALSGKKQLDASGLGVTELSGLECWPELELLDLSYNPELALEQNAAELSQLQRLAELHLDCTSTTQLDALAVHPALRVLSVNVVNCQAPTPLEDASAAGRIAGLEYLDLRGQGLSDVAFLAGAKNLRSLWLGHNRIQSTAQLGSLPLLRELDLNSNGLLDLEGLAGMPHLQTLNVPYNELQQLTPTASLSELRVLNASDNALSALPDWSALEQLREVTVSANQLSTLASLAALPRLGWLNLASNQIGSLAPLVDGSLRGTLVVADNPLPCSVEAAHITALRARGVDVKGSCEQ